MSGYMSSQRFLKKGGSLLAYTLGGREVLLQSMLVPENQTDGPLIWWVQSIGTAVAANVLLQCTRLTYWQRENFDSQDRVCISIAP